MASSDYAYLDSLSQHRDRPGDTSNMNPEFATRLAAAVKQAQAEGLNVGVMSGYRSDTTTGSVYDAGGNSSHGYGLASDISGLDGPSGKVTTRWGQIAEANGLHNPYGIDNKAEFNHWQLPEQPLEKTPDLLAKLQTARATGDWNNVWSAYNEGGKVANAPVDFRNSVYQTLIGKGLNSTQAMGAMYSLMGESGHGLDPSSFNPNDPGGAMGFAQWTGDRRAGLQATAKSMGVPETDPSAQLAYFNQELGGKYKGVIDNIKANASTTADATKMWTADFESPKVNNWAARYASGLKTGSIGSDGSPVWNAPATTPATTAPGATTAVASNAPTPGAPTSVGDALAKLTQDDKSGKSPLSQLGQAFEPKQAPQTGGGGEMLRAPQDESAMLAPEAGQLLSQATQAGAKPLSWSTLPYGSGIAGPQSEAQGLTAAAAGQVGQRPPGLTLNSLSPFGYG